SLPSAFYWEVKGTLFKVSAIFETVIKTTCPHCKTTWYSYFSDNTKFGIFLTFSQGRTDNSWGPRAIRDHGAPVSLPKLKKAYEIGTRGISWGPLLTPGPRAVPEFPNGQSAPGTHT
ncbi:unnamed protein product, partial [Staurois parvus]